MESDNIIVWAGFLWGLWLQNFQQASLIHIFKLLGMEVLTRGYSVSIFPPLQQIIHSFSRQKGICHRCHSLLYHEINTWQERPSDVYSIYFTLLQKYRDWTPETEGEDLKSVLEALHTRYFTWSEERIEAFLHILIFPPH